MKATNERNKMIRQYLNAFAYGPAPQNVTLEDPKLHPSILTTCESYKELQERAAGVCRKMLERQAIERGTWSPDNSYRVSLWVPAATKREAFKGFVTAYFFSDGKIGDTVTHAKHDWQTRTSPNIPDAD